MSAIAEEIVTCILNTFHDANYGYEIRNMEVEEYETVKNDLIEKVDEVLNFYGG